MRPDTISFAKAVTSAYLPLGGVMIPEAMYQAMLDESRKIGTFGHGFTYSGHPVSCAVGAQDARDLRARPDLRGACAPRRRNSRRGSRRWPIIRSSARRAASA